MLAIDFLAISLNTEPVDTISFGHIVAGGKNMAMNKCEDQNIVKQLAERKGLKPGLVTDTSDGIQFTKGDNTRLTVISWDEFFENLERKGLAVYNSNGWLKIMKA